MRKPAQIAIEAATALLVLVAGYPLLHYGELEGITVPNHFDFSGAVTGYGGRDSLITLFLITLIGYVLMSFAQRHTSLINISDRKIDFGSDLVQTMLSDLALCLKLGITALFACVSLRSYLLAIGTITADKPFYISWIITAFIFGVIIFYWVRMRRDSE